MKEKMLTQTYPGLLHIINADIQIYSNHIRIFWGRYATQGKVKRYQMKIENVYLFA